MFVFYLSDCLGNELSQMQDIDIYLAVYGFLAHMHDTSGIIDHQGVDAHLTEHL